MTVEINPPDKPGKQKQKIGAKSAELVPALMQSAGIGIYIVQNGTFQYVDPLFQEVSGYTEKELLGKYSLNYVHPEDREVVRKKAIESLKGQNLLPYEYRFIKKNGDIIWILERVLSTEYRGRQAALGSFMDITERKRAEKKILRFNAILKALKDIDLLATSESDREVLVHYSCNLLSQTGNYVNVWMLLVDKNMGFESLISSGSKEKVLLAARSMKQSGYPMCVNKVLVHENPLILCGKHEGQHQECPLFEVCNTHDAFISRLEARDKIYGVLGACIQHDVEVDDEETALFSEVTKDISFALNQIETEEERKRVEQQLDFMATHDPLTGLPNRTLFNDRINLALVQAQRAYKKLAVMVLDLDRFKDINDTMGHNVGDQVLKAVGERLINILRKSDTVARMGGDEFIVLLSNIARAEDVFGIAEKILKNLQKPFIFNDHKLHITTSIGIATYPNHGENVDTLMKNADTAMYTAKEKGRCKYQLFGMEREEALMK